MTLEEIKKAIDYDLEIDEIADLIKYSADMLASIAEGEIEEGD